MYRACNRIDPLASSVPPSIIAQARASVEALHMQVRLDTWGKCPASLSAPYNIDQTAHFSCFRGVKKAQSPISTDIVICPLLTRTFCHNHVTEPYFHTPSSPLGTQLSRFAFPLLQSPFRSTRTKTPTWIKPYSHVCSPTYIAVLSMHLLESSIVLYVPAFETSPLLRRWSYRSLHLAPNGPFL